MAATKKEAKKMWVVSRKQKCPLHEDPLVKLRLKGAEYYCMSCELHRDLGDPWHT